MLNYADYHPMACLRQELKGSKVVITTCEPDRLIKKGLPESLTIELDINPETDLGETVTTSYSPWKYLGHKFSDDVSNWFSVAINKEVIALRAAMK